MQENGILFIPVSVELYAALLHQHPAKVLAGIKRFA
jgi:hypothetical protein